MKKKHTLYFGFALMTLIGLQSCKTTEEVIGEQPADTLSNVYPLSINEVASGYLTGYGAEGIEEGGVVINSLEEWNALTTKMNSVNKAIKEQSIDFNRVTVLAYFDQIRGSGGYTVQIATATKTGKKIQAQIKKASPEGDAIEIMTQPFHIVIIQKSDEKVSFTE
ncbi:MAG: hypothetical protein ACJASQ_001638 [Crocinitomicaceae bacterium]|jgi:hypothetical protein